MPDVSLGTIPKWVFFDPQGGFNPDTDSHFTTPAVNGYLYAYRSVAKGEKKPFYQDPGGLLAYLNPARLDMVGGIGPIYWLLDEPYYIKVKKANKDGTPGDIIFKMDAYTPAGSGGVGPVTTQIDIKNHIQNGQFTYNFGRIDDTYDVTTNIVNIGEGNLIFEKDTDDATDYIDFPEFPFGQTTVEANPKYYFSYNSTAIGAASETIKRMSWFTNNVETFANQQITIPFWGRSDDSATVNLYVRQNFGTGGGPSGEVDTLVADVSLTPNWTKYHATVIVPSVDGKNLGTNGDDAFFIDWNIPKNEVVNVDLVNLQNEIGNKVSPFEVEINEDTKTRTRGSVIPSFTADEIGKILTVIKGQDDFPGIGNPYLSWSSFLPPGATIIWFGVAVPTGGWLFVHGQLLVRNHYQEMFDSFGVSNGPNGYPNSQVWSNAGYVGTGNVYNLQCLVNGAVTDPQDFGCGLVFNVTQQGTAVLPEKTTATFTFAGNQIVAGSYFLIGTPAQNYTVWYEVNGDGTDPVIVGRISLKIKILDTDTNEQIAQKTWSQGMRIVKFYLPTTKDLMLRGIGVKTDRLSLEAYTGDTNVGGSVSGAEPGTYQHDEFKEHTHASSVAARMYANNVDQSNSRTPDNTKILGHCGEDLYTVSARNVLLRTDGLEVDVTIANTGGTETRGMNVGVNFIIKT